MADSVTTKAFVGEASRDDLSRLRELLLDEDRRRIDELKRRLDDPVRRTEEVGAVLPRAVAQRSAEGDELSEALQPGIERALIRAIQEDPDRIAHVIFPIIGPAIRRSIRQALADIVQRLNQSVEHSLTLHGMRMRLEAARTGVPFAEVVLRHSLLYRVEQLFVIHRETGVLLAKAVDEDVATHSPDLVSSMLTVVQDFVRDSFKVDEGEALESMTIGDLSIWIEPGPDAILAAVIRGTPPQSLRGRLSNLVLRLHVEYAQDLEPFDGDLTRFARMPHRLEAGLASQKDPAREGVSPTLVLLVALLVTLVGGIVGSRYTEGRRVGHFVSALSAEPGIEVTDVRRRDGGFLITGMRDPYAADPLGLVAGTGVDASEVAFRWEPFVGASPELVIRRVQENLELPAGVSLVPTESAIRVVGGAPGAWIEVLRERVHLVAPGVELDLSEWRG